MSQPKVTPMGFSSLADDEFSLPALYVAEKARICALGKRAKISKKWHHYMENLWQSLSISPSLDVRDLVVKPLIAGQSLIVTLPRQVSHSGLAALIVTPPSTHPHFDSKEFCYVVALSNAHNEIVYCESVGYSNLRDFESVEEVKQEIIRIYEFLKTCVMPLHLENSPISGQFIPNDELKEQSAHHAYPAPSAPPFEPPSAPPFEPPSVHSAPYAPGGPFIPDDPDDLPIPETSLVWLTSHLTASKTSFAPSAPPFELPALSLNLTPALSLNLTPALFAASLAEKGSEQKNIDNVKVRICAYCCTKEEPKKLNNCCNCGKDRGDLWIPESQYNKGFYIVRHRSQIDICIFCHFKWGPKTSNCMERVRCDNCYRNDFGSTVIAKRQYDKFPYEVKPGEKHKGGLRKLLHMYG
jgi:hypothetical protein